MTTTGAPRPSQSGFTLLEALVAMILLGLMMAVMTGSIRFAGKSRDAATTRIDSLDNMRIAQDFLRQTIAQSHPKRWAKAVGRPYIFRGERDELFMAAPLTARVGVGGLFLLKFSLVDQGGSSKGKKLIMARQFPEPDTQEVPDFSDAETVVLAENLSEIEFGYLGRDDDNSDPTWTDDWKEPARMPEAVRVRIKPLSGAPWPEMVIPLRVIPRVRGGIRGA
ncbi:MAG: prepilin-type N-terminal cleavage/methylation domain-containing protein [Betaproteobacteria bacterium]